jgi:fatty-acyl-CoA synthase
MPHRRAHQQKLKQGRPPFGVEMKIVDDAGADLPRDGKTFGRLLVRGAAIGESGYFKNDGAKNPAATSSTQKAGSTPATSPPSPEYGFMTITDRAKDVIKSGGEWISSIDIENIAVGCTRRRQRRRAIGIYHPKWDERPLLIIQPKPGRGADEGRKC